MKIAINGGHYEGLDSGAVGGTGPQEATLIQSQTIKSMNTIHRGVKVGNGLYVIKHTNCPAVLVETAFISNEDDEKLLLDDSKLDEFAKAISRGVTDYVGGM